MLEKLVELLFNRNVELSAIHDALIGSRLQLVVENHAFLHQSTSFREPLVITFFQSNIVFFICCINSRRNSRLAHGDLSIRQPTVFIPRPEELDRLFDFAREHTTAIL